MKMLAQLRLVDWIILCLVLSVAGSLMATLVSVAIDIAALGDASYLSNNLALLASDLIYLTLDSLFANALGALFLFSLFAIKRRGRAS